MHMGKYIHPTERWLLYLSMHREENKSTLYESKNNCFDSTTGMDVT